MRTPEAHFITLIQGISSFDCHRYTAASAVLPCAAS
jgi:hypothetical protein